MTLQEYINSRGIPKTKIAKVLGVTTPTIYNYFKTGEITSSKLKPLAEFLNISIDELLDMLEEQKKGG